MKAQITKEEIDMEYAAYVVKIAKI